MTKLRDLIQLVKAARAMGASDETEVDISVFDGSEREVIVTDIRVVYRKSLDRLTIQDPDPALTLDS